MALTLSAAAAVLLRPRKPTGRPLTRATSARNAPMRAGPMLAHTHLLSAKDARLVHTTPTTAKLAISAPPVDTAQRVASPPRDWARANTALPALIASLAPASAPCAPRTPIPARAGALVQCANRAVSLWKDPADARYPRKLRRILQSSGERRVSRRSSGSRSRKPLRRERIAVSCGAGIAAVTITGTALVREASCNPSRTAGSGRATTTTALIARQDNGTPVPALAGAT